MQYRDQESSHNLQPLYSNASNMSNNLGVVQFTNHFKDQENSFLKKEGLFTGGIGNNNDSSPMNYKADKKDDQFNDQTSPTGFVFDITQSFAKEPSLTQVQSSSNNNNNNDFQYQGITGSSCSSFQQLTNRDSSNPLMPLKVNINIPNQNKAGSQMNSNSFAPTINNQYLNTQQSIGGGLLGSQTKYGYDDQMKSPTYKSSQFTQSSQKHMNQENIGLSSQMSPPPAHQKTASVIVHPVTQQQQENKSSLFMPLNQLLSTTTTFSNNTNNNNNSNTNQQESQIIQNNSSVLCNTNAKSSYRSSSTVMNNNSQVNLNVRSILNNNSNTFDLNSIMTNNNFNANNSSLLPNNNTYNFQITNSNYSNNLTNNNNINNNIYSNSTPNNINNFANPSYSNSLSVANNFMNNSLRNNFNPTNNLQNPSSTLNKSNLEDNNKLNLTGMDITNRSFLGENPSQLLQNVTSNNNKSMMNNSNNVSFVANCNNNTIMKVLEKNMDVSQQQVQHLINSSKQLQHSYTIEVEKYMEQLTELKEKQEKCEVKQKKKKRELEEIDSIIRQVESKQEYDRVMVLSSEDSRRNRIEQTFNNHQQLDCVLQKIKNLVAIIPDVKMHENFLSSTQPLESVLKQLSEHKREVIMHMLRERDEQIRFAEYLNALREDFNSYIMQNTEYTLLYEEQSEMLDNLKLRNPVESEYIIKSIEYKQQKDFIQQQLQEAKQNQDKISNEIQHKDVLIHKFNESSQFLQQRLEQARRNKSSAIDYQTYENQFQLFLSESFDENAKQFYKDFIKIFDTEFLQTSISYYQGDSHNFIVKVISFQTLLLQETYLILQNQTTLNCEELRRISDQKRELMIELNQVEMLKEVILSILSYDQLLLNVGMCVRNMKRKDIIMQTFYQYLVSKKTQFSFKFQAQNEITKTTEEYMRVNKELMVNEAEKKVLQNKISDALIAVANLKAQFQQINSNIENNENNFKIHYAKECVGYYEHYLTEKNIVIKDICFTYGKSYVEKLEQDIKEEFSKANSVHLERIREQIHNLNSNMQQVTSKRQRNFRVIEEETKPQYEDYKNKQKESEQKQSCLSQELAEIINKERIYISQLNDILADQFDLKNKKFNKGSALSNLQDLMQQSEDEALSNYNQALQLMLNSASLKKSQQEISVYNQLQLLREKMNVILEELERMTRNDIEVITQMEKTLTKSESTMKEFHSKIEQIHSVLKDQLAKMNLDSDTIFNTFNLNFTTQVLSVKDLINRNQDRTKIILDLQNNGQYNKQNSNANDNHESTKRARCSKSMYIDASKNLNTSKTINHNQSQAQYSHKHNNSAAVQPKYGKITIDMNSLVVTPTQDGKNNTNSSLNNSSYPSCLVNISKENQANTLNTSTSRMNSSSFYQPAKLNQSQKEELPTNSSEAFFNSNASKSNRLMTSSRSQSQIFLTSNRQNSNGNGMLTSGRIPSSILNDPLYNELTSTNSTQGISSQSQGQNNNFNIGGTTIVIGDSNKFTQQITSTTNISSINSPPSLSASKSKSLFKRANSYNNTSGYQNNNSNSNNQSGNMAQQIQKIANGNSVKKTLNRNNSNLFTNWNNQHNNSNQLNNSNLNNFNNTYRDFSPNCKNVLSNYNLPATYNNNSHKQLNKQFNNDQDRSEQNLTLNLSHINHIHNGSIHQNNYTQSNNNNNTYTQSNNLIHNNSIIHNTSINNNINCKNIEQASAFLDISALNMISASNRNDQSGIFTLPINTNGNNNNSVYMYSNNADRSMLASEGNSNNTRALNTSQNRRLNSMSSHQMSTNQLAKNKSISSINTMGNSNCGKYIEIYKMYGISKDNFLKKQTYDPINNNQKPTSFGYAKRFLRINDKTQNLEIIKEELINQQPRKTIEQAYSKLLVKNISIPTVTSSILDYKNEYRFKEPEDEIISKFVNCNNLPFSIEIEKMGKIECIAIHEEDLLYLMKNFCG